MIEHNNIELKSVQSLHPYNANARTHSKQQINQIADSIQEFGFTNLVLIPHPDDIVLTRNQEPIFNGPLCEKELDMIFETCELRDVLAIQWVYESQIKLQPAKDPNCITTQLKKARRRNTNYHWAYPSTKQS